MGKEKAPNDGRLQVIFNSKDSKIIQQYCKGILALPVSTFMRYFLINHVEEYIKGDKSNERNFWR